MTCTSKYTSWRVDPISHCTANNLSAGELRTCYSPGRVLPGRGHYYLKYSKCAWGALKVICPQSGGGQNRSRLSVQAFYMSLQFQLLKSSFLYRLKSLHFLLKLSMFSVFSTLSIFHIKFSKIPKSHVFNT